VSFVDTDVRRQGREFLGVDVRPPAWLRGGGWEQVAVPAEQVQAWQPLLRAAGVEARHVIALPTEEDDVLLDAVVSTLFPDPLEAAIAGGPPVASVRVGIFGTGAGGMKVWEALADMDAVDAVWFADNNVAQQGGRVLGLDVIAPSAIGERGCDAVIVGSMSRGPIRDQLLALGVPADRIVAPDVTAPVDAIHRELSRCLSATPALLQWVNG
jgi:hypothetical protein